MLSSIRAEVSWGGARSDITADLEGGAGVALTLTRQEVGVAIKPPVNAPRPYDPVPAVTLPRPCGTAHSCDPA